MSFSQTQVPFSGVDQKSNQKAVIYPVVPLLHKWIYLALLIGIIVCRVHNYLRLLVPFLPQQHMQPIEASQHGGSFQLSSKQPREMAMACII